MGGKQELQYQMASRHGPRRCGRAEADSNRSRGAVAEDLMSKYCTVLYCTSVPLAIRRLRHSKDHLIEEPAQPACLQRTNRKSGRKTCIAGSISGCNRRCRCRCRRWQQWHSRPLSRCPYPLHRAITWAIPTYCIRAGTVTYTIRSWCWCGQRRNAECGTNSLPV